MTTTYQVSSSYSTVHVLSVFRIFLVRFRFRSTVGQALVWNILAAPFSSSLQVHHCNSVVRLVFATSWETREIYGKLFQSCTFKAAPADPSFTYTSGLREPRGNSQQGHTKLRHRQYGDKGCCTVYCTAVRWALWHALARRLLDGAVLSFFQSSQTVFQARRRDSGRM